MSFRSRFLIIALLFLSLNNASFAQDEPIDYLRHMKYFHLCSFKRECSNCYSCVAQKYRVKIKNVADKEIVRVSYVYYSEVYSRIICKEALLEGDQIDPGHVSFLFVCIPDGRHWAINEIVYADGTKVNFVVKDRLTNFLQEADECDCNPQTHIKPPLN
jgi:hypothetical protein